MRVRWLNSEGFSKAALDRVATSITADAFGDEKNSGFLFERKRSNFLDAKYIERFDWTETIRDPFGSEQEVERREYRQICFRLSTDMPAIEIYDCPRSVSPLLNRLESILGLDFVVTVPEVNVLHWLEQIEGLIETPIVTAVVLSKVSLSVHALAQMSIRGTEDVRGHITGIVGNRPFEIEKLMVSASFDGQTTRFMLRNDCRATILAGSERFLPVLRSGASRVLHGQG